MKKDLKIKVELALNNVKHLCNHSDSIIPGSEIVYLLEKIEDLQANINELYSAVNEHEYKLTNNDAKIKVIKESDENEFKKGEYVSFDKSNARAK